MIKAYFDGSCIPNADGGRMRYGAIIYQYEKMIHTIMQKYQRSDGIASNNIAEYCGVIAVMKYLLAHQMSNKETYIFGDSKLVIMQMSGKWEANKGKYIEYYCIAQSLLFTFQQQPQFEWIPRERNTIADGLANG